MGPAACCACSNRRRWARLCKSSALLGAGRRLDIGPLATPTLGDWASFRLRLLRASSDPGGKQSGQRWTIAATCSTSPRASLAMTSCGGWRSEIRNRAAATVGDAPNLAAHSLHSRLSVGIAHGCNISRRLTERSGERPSKHQPMQSSSGPPQYSAAWAVGGHESAPLARFIGWWAVEHRCQPGG